MRILFLIAALVATAARADVVTDWNVRADALATEIRRPPHDHAATLALVHVAIFESLNAIERRYQPYALDLVADRNTSREAAAASAAHAVLLALYPDKTADLDALLARTLNATPAGAAKDRAVLLGRKAASDFLALRAADGVASRESWRPITQPGVYIPTVIPVATTVATQKTWVLSSAAQVRPAPPPSLVSEPWTRDLNEIREIGGAASAMRTAEQTHIAKFWFLTGPRTYNPIIQHVAQFKKLDLLDCARLYALTSVAAADAFIAVFDAKYAFNFWRPVTAIRNADQTGNPATPRDANWLPLGETPMHPEYPCAHCISSAAVATVLVGLAGDDVGEITLTSATAPGVTRRWKRISEYRDEVSNARIWAGFHYRFSTEVGKDMGRQIGELTLASQMARRK